MKMSPLFRMSVIPLGIHLILWWLLYLLAIVRKVSYAYDVSQVSLAYWSWLWLAAIFTVLINFIVVFKKDFGYHTMMSVSRHVFAGYYLQLAIVYNILVSALILLDLNILRFLNHAYGFLEIDFLSIAYGSQTDDLVYQFLVVFSAMMALSTLGVFIGSYTYRFGITFVWGFWLSVGLGSTILVSLSEALDYRQDLIDSVLWFSGAGQNGGPLTGAGHFVFVSLVLMTVIFMNIRRLQLK